MPELHSITPASADEVAELLGERADDAIVERIANVGASVEEVREAIEDLDFQLRFGEERTPTSGRIKEVRAILEELPYFEDLLVETDDDEYEGLTVIEGDDLNADQ